MYAGVVCTIISICSALIIFVIHPISNFYTTIMVSMVIIHQLSYFLVCFINPGIYIYIYNQFYRNS